MRKLFVLCLAVATLAGLSACRTTVKKPEQVTVTARPQPVPAEPEEPEPAEEEAAEEESEDEEPEASAAHDKPSVPETRPMVRGIWADSWGKGLLAPEQIDEMVQSVRDANLNAIYAEVRKVGDAYYLKGFEPRASNITGPEDWDPLQYLLDQCHDTSGGKRYIEVHAWLVTFRLWRGELEDVPEGHLFAEHPDTIMLNAAGENNASGTYFADPGNPIVQDWTARVFKNLAAEYEIDGIHHDYVRYPEYEGDWGHNPASLERFRKRTGFEGTPAPDNPMWKSWRREQVANVVSRVYGEVMEANPECVVSAATLNWGLEMTPTQWYVSNPRLQANQDWVRFMREGTLDENAIMNYSRYETQPHRFPDYTDLVLQTRQDRHGLIGVGVYMNKVEHGFAQIREALSKGADGVLLYSYNGLNNEDLPRDEYFKRLREEIFPEAVNPPTREWKEEPVYGAIIGQCFTGDDEWEEGATVSLDGTDVKYTDATGFYAFYRILPGEHLVTIRHKDGKEEHETVSVNAGEATRQDFE